MKIKYKQQVIPRSDLPDIWKGVKLQQLRLLLFSFLKNTYSGKVVENLDTGLPIKISVTSARKTAFGEAIYLKKAAAALVLTDIRLAVQFQKGGKYYYNIEINKKKAHT